MLLDIVQCNGITWPQMSVVLRLRDLNIDRDDFPGFRSLCMRHVCCLCRAHNLLRADTHIHTHTSNVMQEYFPIQEVLFREFYLGKNKGSRGMYLTQPRTKEELLEDVGL